MSGVSIKLSADEIEQAKQQQVSLINILISSYNHRHDLRELLIKYNIADRELSG